ncbi:MAG TPA: hypothetical protein VGM95_02360 [Lactobacillaceae bacterium]|jgi:amino acid transporter
MEVEGTVAIIQGVWWSLTANIIKENRYRERPAHWFKVTWVWLRLIISGLVAYFGGKLAIWIMNGGGNFEDELLVKWVVIIGLLVTVLFMLISIWRNVQMLWRYYTIENAPTHPEYENSVLQTQYKTRMERHKNR